MPSLDPLSPRKQPIRRTSVPKRLPVRKTEPASPPQSRIAKSRVLGSWLLPALAVMLFAGGTAIAIMSWRTNRDAQSQISTINQEHRSDDNGTDGGANPSSEKPPVAVVTSYQVAADLPRYLKIDKIGVAARVRPLGLTSNGALAAPVNVYDTGWYMGSAKPGATGATVIDGHVQVGQTQGVFFHLQELVPGDILHIERGDGQVLTYSVVRTQEFAVDAVDMKSLLTPVTPGKGGLNLITCSGSIVPSTGKYNQRLVVYSSQQ